MGKLFESIGKKIPGNIGGIWASMIFIQSLKVWKVTVITIVNKCTFSCVSSTFTWFANSLRTWINTGQHAHTWLVSELKRAGGNLDWQWAATVNQCDTQTHTCKYTHLRIHLTESIKESGQRLTCYSTADCTGGVREGKLQIFSQYKLEYIELLNLSAKLPEIYRNCIVLWS